ncbi:MAG TPA: hypothetical protein VFH55_11535 [Nitrospiria bacterium]|nr:hypothetical protein [Nitrospiria bacterium]
MKKIIFITLFVVLGWLGYSYASAAWTRGQFTREVESLLESPRDLTESSLVPLILNKAQQFGMELRPEDIQIQIGPSNQETTTSNLLQNKGFRVEVRRLTLQFEYGQPFLGSTQRYTFYRDRTFASQAAPSIPPPAVSTEIPEN